MESNSLKNGLQNNEFIDRISDLPDPILGKILSYFPTRNVVATSVLSTRWKPLFPSEIPFIRLDLDDSYTFHAPARSFIDFVDKLLNVDLLAVEFVERVVLNCENGDYEDDKIVSWLCASLRLNVKHLRFNYRMNDSEALFHGLDGCKTLEELEIGNGFDLCLPEEFILPKLKRLLLNSLILGDEERALQGLLVGCPVLNYLSIVRCDLGDEDTLRIHHPVINTLFIDGSFKESRCVVVIDAPSLEAFIFEGQFVAKYIMVNMKSLRSVCIDFDYFNEENTRDILQGNSNRMAKLVEACSSTTRLRLPKHSMAGLCFFSWHSLRTFQNLTCLALGRMGKNGWRILTEFLKSAPNLSILTFEEELEPDYYMNYMMPSLPNLPICLELRLKKIEIWDFQWTPDEIQLIEYFLKNGGVLEELIVHCLPCKKTSDLEKLSILPNRSKACQVVFKDKKERGRSCYSHETWLQAGHT